MARLPHESIYSNKWQDHNKKAFKQRFCINLHKKYIINLVSQLYVPHKQWEGLIFSIFKAVLWVFNGMNVNLAHTRHWVLQVWNIWIIPAFWRGTDSFIFPAESSNIPPPLSSCKSSGSSFPVFPVFYCP